MQITRLLYLVFDVIRFLVKTAYYDNFINYVNKESKYQYQTLIILANGPSLNRDLNRMIKSEECRHNYFMTMNFMANDERFYNIMPLYHVISDPMFFSIRAQVDKVDLFYKNINSRINWEMYLVIPYEFWKNREWRKKIYNSKIKFIPFHGQVPPRNSTIRNWFASKGVCGASYGSVLHHAIYVGILLGFRKILLYGADHTFFDGLCVNEQNQVCRKTTHFYEENVKIMPLYHYYTGEEKPYTMSFFLWEYERIFRGHDVLRSLADYMNVEIINKTSGSMIDSYNRE